MWRWIFIFFVLVCLYVGTLCAVSEKTEPKMDSCDAPHKNKFLRNLFIGLAALFAFDAAVFHSGLYTAVLETKSHAGRIAVHAQEEIRRKPTGRKEIAVLGDSRIAEGFSAKVANELASKHDQTYLSFGINATTPRLWYLSLREIDPRANRYKAIVIPLGDLNVRGELADHPRDISMAAPLLHYGDAYLFGRSFREWSNQCRAFAVCLLRGHAFQPDLFDLLAHPLKRLETIRERPAVLKAEYDYMGRDDDVVGISYDPATKRLHIPAHFPPRKVNNIRLSVSALDPVVDMQVSHAWTDRILDRYARSPTTIVLLPMPRGPLASVVQPVRKPEAALQKSIMSKRAIMLDENLFNFLEVPEFYSDGAHLNAKGRKKFTERLVKELLANPELTSAHATEPETRLGR